MLDELTKVRAGDDVTIELLDAAEFGGAFEAERIPLAYIEYDEHADEASVGLGGREASTRWCFATRSSTPPRS